MKGFLKFGFAVAVLAGSFSFTGTAAATTFCVPAYFAACPDNGSNAESIGSSPGAKLESAMAINGSDGVPDTVYLDSGTYVDSDSFEASGSDDLTVVGSGRDKTTLTSSATNNRYVVNLVSDNFRRITLKDLSIVLPEGFPNDTHGGTSAGYGAAIQISDDELDSVDLINENKPLGPSEIGSAGIGAIQRGSRLNDVRIFGRDGARYGHAIRTGAPPVSCGTGELQITQLDVSGARYGVETDCPTVPVTIDRSAFAVDSAIQAANGAHFDISNVLIESGDLVPVDVYNSAGAGPTQINLNQATIVATGDPTKPAIRLNVANSSSATDSVSADVRNSIVAGFEKTWQVTAPESNTIGDATLNLGYSSFDPNGDSSGDAAVNLGDGNISGNPGFAGLTDYHLAVGSPAVDAGDPNAADPILDLEGNSRPIDGDHDGKAIRDMGAFELNPPPLSCPEDLSLCPPPTCETDPSLCPVPPDTVAPKITGFKFRFVVHRGGTLKFRLSEAAAVKVRFVPVPRRPKRGKKRKVVKITRKAKAGDLRIKLGKNRLKAGRYLVTVTATDKAGNRSKPLKKRVRAIRRHVR